MPFEGSPQPRQKATILLYFKTLKMVKKNESRGQKPKIRLITDFHTSNFSYRPSGQTGTGQGAM